MAGDAGHMDEPAAGAGAGAAAGAAASIGPSSAALAAASASAGLFRRKNRAGGGAGGGSGGAAPPNLRKRGGAGEGSGGDDDDEGGVVRKAKQVKGEPLAFSTKRDEKEDLGVRFEGSRTIQEGRDQAATRALETETQFDRDARCVTQAGWWWWKERGGGTNGQGCRERSERSLWGRSQGQRKELRL